MRRKKERFQYIKESRFVLEPDDPLYKNIRGRWNEKIFKNEQDIVLELACGRGEYTIGFAENVPKRNFIGVDIKGDRIWNGAVKATERGLSNAFFLRSNILELPELFAPHEVSEIWITFPDPRPKLREERRRVTSPRYLAFYKKLLKPGGKVHFKTDNDGLMEYSEEIIKESGATIETLEKDFNASEMYPLHFGIKSRYESIFVEKGATVKYMVFSWT